MRIDVTIDTKELRKRFEERAKSVAFNTANALNETALKIQIAERVNLDRTFTLRRAQFMYQRIKMFAFASVRQNRPFAEIGIDQKPRLLLGMFEQGGTKVSEHGKSVAVPITGGPARPTFRQSVPQPLYVTKLGIRRRKVRRGKPQLKGKLGTFVIPQVGIFQYLNRVTKLLYAYVRAPQLQPVLHFTDVALGTFHKVWPKEWEKAWRR
jgi:hypothetical protein